MSNSTNPKDVMDALRKRGEERSPDTLRVVKEIQSLQRQLEDVGSFPDTPDPLRLPYSSMEPLAPRCWSGREN